MKKALLATVALLGLVSLVPSSARSCGYAVMRSPTLRFANADYVVLGEIVRVETESHFVSIREKDPRKQELRVVIVRILEAFKAPDMVTHLRLGLFGHQKMKAHEPRVFFLTRHFEEPLCLLNSDFGITRNAKRDLTNLETFRKLGHARKNPFQALAAKKNEDRELAVGLLLLEAQARPFGGTKRIQRSAMSPELSRAILLALAEIEWKQNGDIATRPSALFSRLGPTAKNGWDQKNAKTWKDYVALAKDWCRTNADTLTIHTWQQ